MMRNRLVYLAFETSEHIRHAVAHHGSDLHVEIAKLYVILGTIQMALGRAAAKDSLLQAAAIFIHIYGTDQHPDVAEIYSLLLPPVEPPPPPPVEPPPPPPADPTIPSPSYLRWIILGIVLLHLLPIYLIILL